MSWEYEIVDLHVKFNRVYALKGLNLKIETGTFNVILGPNGSGKSTFLRCLGGLQNWHSGDILKKGISRGLDTAKFNTDQILISEDIQLPKFSIEKLVIIYKELWPSFNQEVFDRIISYSDISLKKEPQKVSRGQNILCQFALGLATGVKTILIDEVTATLDPFVRNNVIGELLKAQKDGATVILATNIATEIPQADINIILLKDANLYRASDTSSLKKEFITATLPATSSLLLKKIFVPISRSHENEIIAIGPRDSLLEETTSMTDPTIEDIFIYLSYQGKK